MSTTVITIDDEEYEVDYEYQPYEPMEIDYPGCPEGVEVWEVRDENGDVVTELDDYDVGTKTLNALKEGRAEAQIEAFLDSKEQ
jgi:hypothetical protein